MSTIQSLRTRAASCSRFLLAVGLAVGAGAIAAACGGDEPAAPPLPGSIQVTVATTGSDLDPDGYTITADGGASEPVGVDGSVTFSGLPPGDHNVALEGVAANCAVAGGNSRTVTVTAGQTAGAVFTITCIGTNGDLEIAAVTTGSNPDPDGYNVSVDAGPGQALGANGTITITTAAGDHLVELSGVATNCAVTGDNPQMVTVPPGGTVQTTFVIECTSVTGTLVLSVVTTGEDLDPDGYLASLNGGVDQPIGINGTITLTSVAAGQRTVALSDVADNCSVTGDNPRTVTVPAGGTVQTTFVVVCTSLTGSVQVTTVTTGSDLDPDGYSVLVNGGLGRAIGVNATVTIPGVEPGDRSVELLNLASNCSVDGANPRTVTVAAAATVQTTFLVECVPPTGSLVVIANTTGADLDPDGYTVSVDGGPGQALATNGAISITDVQTGNRLVALSGVADNCAVSDDNPRTVTVPGGGTIQTTFIVSCLPQLSNQIAFETQRDGNPEIYVMNPDGSGLLRLTDNPARDAEPYVSFDGTKIAFVSDRDGGDNEIWVMNVDGTNLVRLTNSLGSDTEPAWSPDGTKIAFASERDGGKSEVYVMNADGSDPVRLTNVAGRDGLPAWSPDGTQIAFMSERDVVDDDGNLEIYVMNADGSGVPANLTNNLGEDFGPEYSPNGDKIVFTSKRDGNRDIWVMNVNGTNPLSLTTDPAADLAADWSPDGLQIVFVSQRDGNSEIFIMNADGTGQVNLTNRPLTKDFEPSWNR